MGIDGKTLRVRRELHKVKTNVTEVDRHKSNTETQEAGIRQGYPLSSYLFLLIMAALFEDAHGKLIEIAMGKHWLEGIEKDEIRFSDDTICISKDAKCMNELLETIEEESEKVGMELNYAKCDMISIGKNHNVHSKHGRKIRIKAKAEHLGAIIHESRNPKDEVRSRKADYTKTWGN